MPHFIPQPHRECLGSVVWVEGCSHEFPNRAVQPYYIKWCRTLKVPGDITHGGLEKVGSLNKELGQSGLRLVNGHLTISP